MILKSIFFAAMLALPIAAIAAPCNKAAAQDVRKMMAEFAKWELGSDTGKIKVTWNHKTDSQSTNGILRLMSAFADADACLMGYPRKIHFYRMGKQEGIASPDHGVKLTN
ncbi:hypothetical protein OPV09_17665 [Janthinobacterium sp. TB1-E2]|uniref:Uncharacterized protein n=1 Tax=Janthinobacterium aestuarii TaxID=2985511 RepID=A0ABZ2GKH8_9BURK